MRKFSKSSLLIGGLLLAGRALAGTDPVAWSISPSSGLPAQTNIGSSYAVTYTLTNNLPFAVPLSVSSSYVGGSFSLTNGCNTTLAAKGQANSSCLVHLSFQPDKVGRSSAVLTMAYHKNRVPLPQLSSTASSSETTDGIYGRATTPLPAVTYTNATYPVAFTFVNNGANAVTASSVNVSGFSASSNTCTAQLSSNGTCVVSGTFSPSTAGSTILGVTYNYSSKSVPVTTQTNVVQQSGACHHVDGFVSLPLPVSTYQYADNVVKYVFTNECDASTETLGAVTLSSDAAAGGATILKGADTCSNQTIAANSSCTVFASVVPNVTTSEAGDLSVSASVPYNSNTAIATATTSEIVNAIPNQSSQHTILFVNQCNQNVWYEFQNGIGGSGTGRKSPDPTPDSADAFSNYLLPIQLAGAAPSTISLSFNEYINGAIYGRTNCNITTGVCQTAYCPVISGTGKCQAGIGATNPTTIFEGTLASATASDGSYDVSLVNGFNLPGEMRSLAPTSSNLFGCGQSGGAIIQPAGATAGTSLGACSWSFSPPSTGIDSTANYYWVSSGADDACSPSCTGSNVCGTAFNSDPPGTAPINRRCGTFQGYWTVADFVGYTSSSQWGSVNLYSTYSLGSALTTGPSGQYGNVVATGQAATIAALYACTKTDFVSGGVDHFGLLSGYSSTYNACGCYDWNQSGSVAPTAQAANCAIGGVNSDWTNTVFNRINWLKQACPTAYSYQYDDESTSFTCNVANQKTSYEIVFCPGGKTGAPGT